MAETSDSTREELFSFLTKVLGLSVEELRNERTKSHPAAHTIEEWESSASPLFPGAKMCKNLFLRDKKKGSLWLAVALSDTPVDMKKLTKELGFSSGTLRFAGEEILLETLGVKQGAVTPLALFNDMKEKKVNVLIDSRMVEQDDQHLLFHPLSNEFSTMLTAKELKAFLQACGHSVTFKDF